MTNNEIKILLEELEGLDFLPLMEKIFEEEREYKKSLFFKKTRISLSQLFRDFTSWKRNQTSLFKKIIKEIEENEDVILERIHSIIDKANSDPDIVGGIQNLIGDFNLEELEEYTQELKGEIENLKE